MTRVSASTRLMRPAASDRQRHLAGFASVAVIAGLLGVGVAVAPIAFLAVGAGAGYSLSGSV